jgi:hypothetical protein
MLPSIPSGANASPLHLADPSIDAPDELPCDAQLGTRITRPVMRRLRLTHAVTAVPMGRLVDRALDMFLSPRSDLIRQLEQEGDGNADV